MLEVCRTLPAPSPSLSPANLRCTSRVPPRHPTHRPHCEKIPRTFLADGAPTSHLDDRRTAPSSASFLSAHPPSPPPRSFHPESLSAALYASHFYSYCTTFFCPNSVFTRVGSSQSALQTRQGPSRKLSVGGRKRNEGPGRIEAGLGSPFQDDKTTKEKVSRKPAGKSNELIPGALLLGPMRSNPAFCISS